MAVLRLEDKASEREASDFNLVSPIAFLPAGRMGFQRWEDFPPPPEFDRGIVVQLLSHFLLCVTPGLQDARNPLPSLSSRVRSNSCPLSQ